MRKSAEKSTNYEVQKLHSKRVEKMLDRYLFDEDIEKLRKLKLSIDKVLSVGKENKKAPELGGNLQSYWTIVTY